MINVPRALGRDLSLVFRRLGRGRPAAPVLVEWIAGRDGLTIQAVGPDAAVRHHVPGRQPEARFVTSVSEFTDGSGPLVTIRPEPGLNGRPRLQFPTPPKRFTEVSGRLFAALAAAGSVAARDFTTGFVLNRIQLRGGRGSVVASDAKQLLVQTGFAFPWSGDVLVPNAEVCSALATRTPENAAVARTATHVWIRSGPWTVVLPVHEGRFPEVDPLVARTERPGSELILGDADRERLIRELPKLPDAMEEGRPVTIDLAGPVLRAGGEKEPVATVPLPHSRVQGKRIRLTCDRTYLLAALKLGFTRMSASTADQPLVWRDDTRTHLFLPLSEPDSDGPEPQPRTRKSTGTTESAPAPVRPPKPSGAVRPSRVPPAPPVPSTAVAQPERCRKRPKRTAGERNGWGGLWSRLRGLFRGPGRSG